jgi:hypothetical protein
MLFLPGLRLNPVIPNEVKDILFQRFFARSQNDDSGMAKWLPFRSTFSRPRLASMSARSVYRRAEAGRTPLSSLSQPIHVAQ